MGNRHLKYFLVLYNCEVKHKQLKGGKKMKSKRFIVLFTLLLSATLLLGACGSNNNEDGNNDENGASEANQEPSKKTAGTDMQDGTYALEEQNFDENGWKVFMEITVEDGKITDSNYNYTDEDGQLKTDDQEYQDMMKDKAGVGPQEFVKQLNEGLIATQDAKLVDIVSGATHSSEIFTNYAQQLIQAAQNGHTETLMIDNGESLKDGEYLLQETNLDSNGWKVTLQITVDGGEIVETDYNYVNDDGELKSDDDEYQEFMADKAGVGPQDFLPALNKELTEKQDPTEVDVVSGATSSSEIFKIYAAQLINAAEKGDTTEIVVDNFVYETED